MSRPRDVMTPEKEAEVLMAVRLGLREGTAARVSEIAPQTLRSHRDRNPGFAEKLAAAEATGERNALAAVVEKMRKDWKAAAWFLERRFAARWGSKIQVGGDAEGEPIQVETKGPPVPETDGLVQSIAKLQALAQEHFGDDEK